MAKNSIDTIRRQLVESVRRTFDFHRSLHPGESFYGFALIESCPTGEALVAVSATEETFQRQQAKSPALPSYVGMARYCPDEWWFDPTFPPHDDFGWKALGPKIPLLCTPDNPNGVLDAMIDTLAVLDREGYFGRGKARAAVTLMTYISDDAISEEWWPASVRKLNPPSVAKRFLMAIADELGDPESFVLEQMRADRVVKRPTWDDVMLALQAHDAGKCKRLELVGSSIMHTLTISRFAGLGYCVVAREAGESSSLLLCDPAQGDQAVDVEEDGELMREPRAGFCPRAMAVAAVEHFYQTGKRSPALRWEDPMDLARRAGIE